MELVFKSSYNILCQQEHAKSINAKRAEQRKFEQVLKTRKSNVSSVGLQSLHPSLSTSFSFKEDSTEGP